MKMQHVVTNKSGSVFAAIVVVLFIATLIVLSGALYWEKEKLTEKYISEKEQMQRERERLKERIIKEQSEKERNGEALLELEERYAELKGRHEKLEREYSEIVKLKELIEGKFEEFTNKTSEELKKIEAISSTVNKRLTEIARGGTSSRGSMPSDPNVSVKKRGERSIDLPPVVVKEDKRATEPKQEVTREFVREDTKASQSNAQIMSVNEEHNFVVINKGLVDGIKVDDLFAAFRDNQKIAVIRISEIRDFVSLGLIKELKQGFDIREGDLLAVEHGL